MDGKPISQMFADELHELIVTYRGSGLSNAECVGVLHMADVDMTCQLREKAIRDVTDPN